MKIQMEELKGKSHCGYCRKLMKQLDYPKILEIYRGDMLCLTVNVEVSAQYRLVEEDKLGLRYIRYKPEVYDMLKTYTEKQGSSGS